MVMLAAVPLAPSLMISWPVLTTTPMPSVDAGEIGRKSSQSKVPCGGLWFEDNFTSLLNFIIGWCGDMYYVFLQVDNWRDPYEQGSRMFRFRYDGTSQMSKHVEVLITQATSHRLLCRAKRSVRDAEYRSCSKHPRYGSLKKRTSWSTTTKMLSERE